MLQCFATLYKFVGTSYGNRDAAFKTAVREASVKQIRLIRISRSGRRQAGLVYF